MSNEFFIPPGILVFTSSAEASGSGQVICDYIGLGMKLQYILVACPEGYTPVFFGPALQQPQIAAYIMDQNFVALA